VGVRSCALKCSAAARFFLCSDVQAMRLLNLSAFRWQYTNVKQNLAMLQLAANNTQSTEKRVSHTPILLPSTLCRCIITPRVGVLLNTVSIQWVC